MENEIWKPRKERGKLSLKIRKECREIWKPKRKISKNWKWSFEIRKANITKLEHETLTILHQQSERLKFPKLVDLSKGRGLCYKVGAVSSQRRRQLTQRCCSARPCRFKGGPQCDALRGCFCSTCKFSAPPSRKAVRAHLVHGLRNRACEARSEDFCIWICCGSSVGYVLGVVFLCAVKTAAEDLWAVGLSLTLVWGSLGCLVDYTFWICCWHLSEMLGCMILMLQCLDAVLRLTLVGALWCGLCWMRLSWGHLNN